ncbi:DnaD domain protein [Anaerobutyricum hallii DSM 3353]|uniref:DnaD domain protein n=2 Tax=Anaerobutyricum hallii TaxID=39488 RepID=C0EYI6_9FIRM|nr:DnaD domain protein [Anaerobutyricum hallii DSM 3353]
MITDKLQMIEIRGIMSDKITLLYNVQNEVTVLPNKFIDEYMIKADGEYVKIYLLILRLQGMGLPVDVERIADYLELTRKDVLRALSYWEKAGILRTGAASETAATVTGSESMANGISGDTGTAQTVGTSGSDGNIITSGTSGSDGNTMASESTGQTGASLSPTITPVPDKNTLSPTEVQASMTNKDLERTIYMAETYIGRPFSTTELNSFCYINDQLHFSSDLLEYLIEYCVTRGKKSVRYIESVAINWYQQGITSVQEAKEQSTLYSQNVFPIMKAFGISNRDPGSAELDYIKKWNSLGLGTDIIIEACSRTLLATHQASFPYANKILEDWKRLGVRNTSDIKHLDDKHRSTASSSSGSAAGYTQGQPRKGSIGAAARKNTATNQFHNFEQRTYDFNDLESRLLDKTRR